jgi:hypothetical protein
MLPSGILVSAIFLQGMILEPENATSGRVVPFSRAVYEI